MLTRLVEEESSSIVRVCGHTLWRPSLFDEEDSIAFDQPGQEEWSFSDCGEEDLSPIRSPVLGFSPRSSPLLGFCASSPTSDTRGGNLKNHKRGNLKKGVLWYLKEMIPKSFLQQLSSFSTADPFALYPILRGWATAMEKVEELMQQVKLLKERLATAGKLMANQALESKEGKRKAYR
ncbi:hypothetical protein Patl1_02012 [Pistacia atlantica]|uniref:Uncharacterized protein n=1 Tax=Pistacia atlantica TaxID=434234 RepID=A0ACC1C4K1_9ROSI|nr:hypothetical protein Patl1_02012 [Pistacia atlantica]